METIRRLLIGVAISALLPATALAQKVSYDFAPGQNFSRLKTFSFKDSRAKETTREETTTYDSPFITERTNAAVAAQLEGRGMRRDDNNPDVYVTTRRTFKTEYVFYGPYGYGWGYPYYWGYGYGYGGPTYTEELIYGTLTIDLEDANTGELLWRGVGTKRVHESSKPEKRTKRVVKEVSKIFEKYPPPGAAGTYAYNRRED